MSGKRDFLSLHDLGTENLLKVLDRADVMRAQRAEGIEGDKPLRGKSVALIFEKPSTRTRVSFEVGVVELGGHPVVLNGKDTQMGRGEPVQDTARVLSRYVHAIVIRTFSDALLATLAKHASVPVVNALTDGGHPCQVLADLQAVRIHKKTLKGLKYAWVGDGNNVANSWIEAATLLDLELVLATPEGFAPSAPIDGKKIKVVRSVAEALEGADVAITDVWASMGQEAEVLARKAAFEGYAITPQTMAKANKGAIALHCLPAHRGEEIDASYIDGEGSVVWDEAECRLHAQKALLEHLVR